LLAIEGFQGSAVLSVVLTFGALFDLEQQQPDYPSGSEYFRVVHAASEAVQE